MGDDYTGRKIRKPCAGGERVNMSEIKRSQAHHLTTPH